MLRIGGHLGGNDSDILTPLQRAVRAGYKTLQIFVCPDRSYFPHKFSESTIKHFLQMKKQHEVYVSVHGNYWVNGCFNGEGNKLGVGRKSLIEQIKAADAIGADALVSHPGSLKGVSLTAGIDCLVETSQKVLDRTEDCQTKLVWEITAGGGTTIGHTNMLLEVLKRVNDPRCRMCFDTTHAWAAGQQMDNHNSRAAIWQAVFPWLECVHLNIPDPNVAKGSKRDRHTVPWNKGFWDERIMRDLIEELQDFPLIMEARDNSSYEYNLTKVKEWFPDEQS